MSNILEYKGYHSKIEYDVETCTLRGKIEGINDYIDFESDCLENIVNEFHSAVDDYLEFCVQVGKTPEKEYKGTFNVRLDPKLHKEIAIDAIKNGISLNATVEKAIEQYLSSKKLTNQFFESSISIPTNVIRTESPYVNNEAFSIPNQNIVSFRPRCQYNYRTKVVNN